MSLLLVPMLISGVLFDVAFTLVRRFMNGNRLTQAHRSHLYQIAHRSGMDARWIAVLHWLFAAIGGAVAIEFTFAAPSVKLALPFVLVVPQLLWLGYVVLRARGRDIGPW